MCCKLREKGDSKPGQSCSRWETSTLPPATMLLLLQEPGLEGRKGLFYTCYPSVHEAVSWGLSRQCWESSTSTLANKQQCFAGPGLDGCRGLFCVEHPYVSLFGMLCRARCRWPQGELHWRPQAAERPSTHRPCHWQGSTHKRGDCSGSAGESCGAAPASTWCLLALPSDIWPAVVEMCNTQPPPAAVPDEHRKHDRGLAGSKLDICISWAPHPVLPTSHSHVHTMFVMSLPAA